MGHMENTVRADTHKQSCRKTRGYREVQRERESRRESEWKKVGGVTLSLLPNLASESATTRRGVVRVVGETDISGLTLLEAHLGLEGAAEDLDLTSHNTAPAHLHTPLPMHIHSPQMHPSLCTELFPTKLLTLFLGTRYLKHAAPTQIPSQPHYLPIKTSSHTHSFPTNTPLSASTTVSLHLFSHHVDILPPFIQ